MARHGLPGAMKSPGFGGSRDARQMSIYEGEVEVRNANMPAAMAQQETTVLAAVAEAKGRQAVGPKGGEGLGRGSLGRIFRGSRRQHKHHL